VCLCVVGVCVRVHVDILSALKTNMSERVCVRVCVYVCVCVCVCVCVYRDALSGPRVCMGG